MSEKSSEQKTVYIYSLIDPRTGEPRYIGETINPDTRLSLMKADPHSKRIKTWLKGLQEEGKDPEMEILEKTEYDNAEQLEARLIDEYREKYALLNSRDSKPYPEHRDGYERKSSTSVGVQPEIANRLNERRDAGEGYNSIITKLLDATE